MYGYGEITKIILESDYPVVVEYDIKNRRESYTMDGKWSKEAEMPEIYIQQAATPQTKSSTMKKGQKIWSCMYGYGEIIEITPESDYPVTVRYNKKNRCKNYTLEGKSWKKSFIPEIYITKETDHV